MFPDEQRAPLSISWRATVDARWQATADARWRATADVLSACHLFPQERAEPSINKDSLKGINNESPLQSQSQALY